MQELERHVIAAGTVTYQELRPLPKVRDDLASMCTLFSELGYQAVPPSGMLDLGADALRRTLGDWAAQRVRRVDTVVLYHSGHGESDQRRHYLLCVDSDPGQLASTALATEDVADILIDGAECLLLIIDTCHAGHGTANAARLVAQQTCAALGLLAGATGTTRYRRGPSAFSVIACARARDEAEDGAFSEAFAAAVRQLRSSARAFDPVSGGQRQEYLDLQDIVAAVNARFESAQLTQRAATATLVSDGVGFIPKPVIKPSLLPVGVDIAEQQAIITTRQAQPTAAMDRFFTGRASVIKALCAWLRGETRTDAHCAVLTGSPGAGKSAILEHLALMSRRMQSHTTGTVAAGRMFPPDSAIVTIPLRRMTVQAALAALSGATNTSATDVDQLVAGLADRMQPLIVLADAVDEAGAVNDTTEAGRLAGTLRELARLPCVRLIVGTLRHLVAAFEPRAFVIDLDDPRWTDISGIAGYARQLLLHPHGPGSSSPFDSVAAGPVADAIARRAHPNFLVARITARALAAAPHVLDMSVPAWEENLPATVNDALSLQKSVGEVGSLWPVSYVSPQQTERARTLLTPLAFAEGVGLPWAKVWLALAAAIAGEPCADEDVAWVVAQAGAHIVEDVDCDGRSVYRLYHDSYARRLRADAPSDAQRRIVEALMSLVPLHPDDANRDWIIADRYIRQYLSVHAAAAGMLDQLLADREFLVHAEPEPLAPWLHLADTHANSLAVAVYRNCLGLPGFGQAAGRRQLLAMTAARFGAGELAQHFARGATGNRIPGWSTGSQASPALLTTLRGPRVSTWSIATAEVHGRAMAVAAHADGSVRLWDITGGSVAGAPLGSHIGAAYAVDCIANEQGDVLAVTGGADRDIRIWNLVTGCMEGEPLAGHTDAVTAVMCMTLNGHPAAASAANDGTVRLWDLTGSMPKSMVLADGLGQVWSLTSVACDEGPLLLAGCVGGVVRAWNLHTGESRQSLYVGVDASVYALAASNAIYPDPETGQTKHGPVVVAGCADGSVTLLDLRTGNLLHEPIAAHTLWVSGAAIAKVGDRHVAVTASGDQTVRQWCIPSGTESARALTGHSSGVLALSCADIDGTSVVVTGSDDGTLRTWQLEPAAAIGDPLPGHSGGVQAVLVADGPKPLLISGGRDKTVRRWRPTDGRQIEPPLASGAEVWALAVATVDNREIIVAGSSDGLVHRWFLDDGEPCGRPVDAHGKGRDKGVWALACVRFKGRTLAVTGGADRVIRRWDLSTGRPFGPAMPGHDGWVLGLDCTAVGQSVAIVSGSADGTVGFWDLATGERRGRRPRRQPHAAAVMAVACTAIDERSVAISCGLDGAAYIWDVETGALDGDPLVGHRRGICSVACGTTGGRPVVITGGEDCTIRTWDLESRQCTSIHCMPVVVNALALEPDGSLIVAYGWEVAVMSALP